MTKKKTTTKKAVAKKPVAKKAVAKKPVEAEEVKSSPKLPEAKVKPKKKDPSQSLAAIAKAKNDARKKQSEESSGDDTKTKITDGGYKRPGTMMRDLLLERKYTDEEIFEKVSKAFPEKTVKQIYCNNWRFWINNLSGMKSIKENPVERLFLEDGKIIPRSQKPKVQKKIAKKYTKENDPLLNYGIDVHKPEKPETEADPKKTLPKVAVKRILK